MIDDFSKEVAPLLGWTFDEQHSQENWKHFDTENGSRFEVMVSGYGLDPKQFRVSGNYTREFQRAGLMLYTDERGLLPSVNISRNKTPEQIAKEIRRRVVEPYEMPFAIMAKRLAEYQKSRNSAAAVALQCFETLKAGGLNPKLSGTEGPDLTKEVQVKTYGGGDLISLGDMRCFQDSVRFEYSSFSHELTRRICQTIADFHLENEQRKAG